MTKRIRKGKATRQSKRKHVVKSTVSLTDFVRKERQKDCLICTLPRAIQDQLMAAPEKKIKLADRVQWLNEVCGVDAKVSDLTKHMNARHHYA